MEVISGAATDLSSELCSKISNYRHKVFVETLQWQLATKDDAELDQFDRDDTVYVVAQDRCGHVNGCARLLPTDQPYLLAEVFPQLLENSSPPSTPDVWELSRFAAMDFNKPSNIALGQFSSPIAVKLLQASIACAAAHGAKKLITVSPIGVERLLRRAGFRARRSGPPMVVGGHPIFACWIDV